MANTSIGSIFSSLGQSGSPTVPNIFGSMSGSTPQSVAPTLPKPQMVSNLAVPQTPAPLSFGIPTSPAVPNLGAFGSMSGSTPATIPSQMPKPTIPPPVTATTPAVQPKPVIPATTPAALPQNPSTSGNAIVTTPSGAQVNQYTGALVTPAPSSSNFGSTPTVPNSIFGTATSGLSSAGQGTSPVAPSVQGLQSLAAVNPANSGPGVSGYDTAVENLANFESGLQTELGNTGRQPIPMPFIQGQQQVIGEQNQGILAALSNAVSQAQTGVQLGETGVGLQETGLNEAGTLANAGQTTKQNALEEAAAATQPVAGATFFGTPETGGMVGTGSADMASAVALQAEKLQNGTTDPASAAAALAAYGQPGINALQQALGANFSIPGATGSAAATESNTELSGTATPTAESSIYQQALSDYSNLQTYTQNVDGFGQLLTSGMTDSSGNAINPTSDKYTNMTIAAFRNELSSPSQAQFDSTLAALRAKVSGMLSIGGSETPTQLTTDANSIINGSAPVGTLQATLDRIQQEGQTLLTNQAQKVNTAKQNITPPSTSNFGTGGSSSGAVPSGWNW